MAKVTDNPSPPRKLRLSLLFLGLALLAGPSSAGAGAQKDGGSALQVSAFNRGVFACQIDPFSFDFGPVDARGTDYGTPGVVAMGRDPSAALAVYRSAPGAVTWTCRSAPPVKAEVRWFSAGSQAGSNSLQIRIPLPQGATWDTDPGTGARSVSGISLGNARFALSSRPELYLTVSDGDPAGFYGWDQRFEVYGVDHRPQPAVFGFSVTAIVPETSAD